LIIKHILDKSVTFKILIRTLPQSNCGTPGKIKTIRVVLRHKVKRHSIKGRMAFRRMRCLPTLQAKKKCCIGYFVEWHSKATWVSWGYKRI